MQIESKKIEELKPYARNPRVNDASVDAVANSIKEFGFKVPIVVDKNNVIVTGHTRYKAAKKLGLDKVPCIMADDLSDDINSIDLSDFGFDVEAMLEQDEEMVEKKKLYEAMELKAFEHYDYVVFVFKNTMDWLNIVNEFGLKKVDAGYGKKKKVGIGRVIDGKRLLEKIQYKGFDIEQEQK